MKTSEFNFFLPEHLIAQQPPDKRGQSRLMTLNRCAGLREHKYVAQLPDILCKNDFLGTDGQKPLLVFNNSKVRKARLIANSSDTGAETEFLLLEKKSEDCWKAMTKRAQKKKPSPLRQTI